MAKDTAHATVADMAKSVEITEDAPTEVGARYMVNGVVVDAWGEPVNKKKKAEDGEE